MSDDNLRMYLVQDDGAELGFFVMAGSPRAAYTAYHSRYGDEAKDTHPLIMLLPTPEELPADFYMVPCWVFSDVEH